MDLTLHPAKIEDISIAATLIARTYLGLGTKMIELTGQLRSLPSMADEYGVLIADSADEAVGYALFTPVGVGDTENAAALLAPLAYDATREEVDPNKVLEKALLYAQQKKYRYVLMHGDPELYTSLGFKDAEEQGITTAVRYPETILLVKDFAAQNPSTLKGAVAYPEVVRNL